MEISTPVSPVGKKYHSQVSVQDICFLPKSHYLIPYEQPIPLPLTYEAIFNEIKTETLGKKTMNTNWQERYFVLTPIRLLYFSNEERNQLKGCFNLASLVQYKLEVCASFPEIRLKVAIPIQQPLQDKIILTLQILNQSGYNEWLTALRTVVQALKANSHELRVFPRLRTDTILQNNQKIGRINQNFWNRITISPVELLNYAEHLDIVFLRSKSMVSKLHRFFMRSYYDHVGILLKDEAAKPYILEVVHEKGVILSPLKNLLASGSLDYEEIGYRKLLTKSQLLPLQKLQSYINSLIGKKYELSLSKIFLNNQSEKDVINQSDSQAEGQKSERTYFCSQLVADIYLKFGVLKEGKSNQFWPKDFEEDSLPFNRGYSLSPIMRVELNQDDLQQSAKDE